MQYERGICDGKNEESVSKNLVCVSLRSHSQRAKSRKRETNFFFVSKIYGSAKLKIKKIISKHTENIL